MSAPHEARLAGDLAVPLDALGEWRMAGRGSFRRVGPGVVESEGGPGILWYPHAELSDFVLRIDWQLSAPDDNSGVCVRIPRLGHDDPVEAEGPALRVRLNGVAVCALDNAPGRRTRGYVGLQAHHPGSRVRFRRLRVRRVGAP